MPVYLLFLIFQLLQEYFQFSARKPNHYVMAEEEGYFTQCKTTIFLLIYTKVQH
jgi:hypothetical protein